MADPESDREFIVDLIHRNRIGIWTNDFDLWSSCMAHTPYLVRWGWWRQGGLFVRVGWDDLSARLKANMPPYNEDFAFNTVVEELRLEIRCDVAWATFVQKYPGYDIPGHVGPGVSQEMRVFERIEGTWKIALFGFLDGNSGERGEALLRLSPTGEVLWRSDATELALSVSDDLVVRNRQLRFRNSKLQQKFADALSWATSQDSGYMSASGSVPIVVDAGEGQPVSVYWVIADSGMVFFALINRGLSQERLRVAALIFGLSPGQERVAGLVAEGLSLPEIAKTMAVKPNTARTHLKRLFEKTGVRTQPALVRILLSTASPL